MEEDIMYSTELIRKFPETPQAPILYVVYNESMVFDARVLITTIHGADYFDEHVTVVPLSTKVDDHRKYDVYMDPTVYKYMHSWND